MEVTFPGELDSRLSKLASQQGRDRSALILEAVERLLDYNEWFAREVEKGLAEAQAGQTLSHEEVGSQLENYLASGLSHA